MSFIQKSIKYFIMQTVSLLRFRTAQLLWLKNNRHNKTRMGNYFPADRVNVGRFSYGKLIVHHFDADGEELKIGNFCSIGPDVEFFLGGEHHPKYISNYPFSLYCTGLSEFEKLDRTTKGKIVIEDDVWIGAHVLILSGVHIGQGAIIGAGSVVTKDVPPYAIYAANEIKKYRFSPDIITQLLKIDYSKITKDFIKNNAELFYSQSISEVLLKTAIKEVIND